MIDRVFQTSRLTPPDLTKGPGRWILVAVALLVVFAFFRPWVVVGPGERGVVLNFGAVQNDILQPGIHGRIPVMQQVELLDVQVQKDETDATAASKDLQDTHSRVALNYHLMPDKVNWIYQNLGRDFGSRIIEPMTQEVDKAVTARFTAVDLITQRDKVRQEIRDTLKARLATYNIAVDDFSIVNFEFSKQFTQAIEDKQTAEQRALKAQRDLDRIKVEAQQKITQARADAEAFRLQRAQVTPELLALRRIQVTEKAIDKWDGHLPQVSGGATPFIDVGTMMDKK
jgi:prohibitin 2